MNKMSEFNSSVEFWIVGVIITVVSVLGFTGNIICILMFQYKRLNINKTFASLLSWLAIIDSFFLMMCFSVFSLPVLSQYYKAWVFPHVLPTLLPLTSISLTCSLYCVVALSTERYLSMIKSEHQNKGSFFGYVLPVIVFSSFFNIPKFFEFSTQYMYLNDRGYYKPVVKATEFRERPDYSFYVLGSSFVFLGIVPFIVLIILNIGIARKLSNNFNSNKIEQVSMSIFLSGIVIVQLVSHVPRTALNIYELYMSFTSSSLSISYSWVVDLSHLFLVISSASNVLIFSAQDIRFRTLLLSHLKKSLLLYKTNSISESDRVCEELIVNSCHPVKLVSMLLPEEDTSS